MTHDDDDYDDDDVLDVQMCVARESSMYFDKKILSFRQVH